MMLKIRKVAQKPRGDSKEAPRITKNDIYVANLVKVVKFKSHNHPDWDESFRFIFRVLQDPFVGGFASGIRPSHWSKGSKLDQWLVALGVEQSEDGDELDVDAIRGQKVRIAVKLSPDGFANITDIYEMRDQDHELIAEGALDNDFKKKEETKVAEDPAPAHKAASLPPLDASTVPAVKATSEPAPAPVVKTPPVQEAPKAVESADTTQSDDIPF